MKLSKKTLGLGAVALAVAGAVAVQLAWHPFGRLWKGQPRQVALDFARPDALIDSESLSRLPRDMLRVPLLRDVLTEDFVNYYEDNEGRLSVAGALRRIAFEHDLDWTDALLRRVFDEPARVMLWRGPDGKLRYWALAMDRNGLAKVLQALGTVAPGDKQLTRAGEIDGVPLYALRIGPSRSLLLIGKGDRLVALSEAGMLLDAEGAPIGERARAVAAWLSADAASHAAMQQSFALEGERKSGHRVVVGANYLSFGYQTYFPAIEALRFDFSPAKDGATGWRTSALTDGARLPQSWNGAALWQALPSDPAACAMLPVDWQAAGKMLKTVTGGADALARQVGEAFTGPAAVCWYDKSPLAAPLFAASIRSEEAATALKPVLGTLFEQVIGAHEPKAGGEKGQYVRLPVQEKSGAAARWMRPVSSPYGTKAARGTPFAGKLTGGRYFPVTLALTQRTVLFSPDAALVDDALAVLAKRYPAASDSMARATLGRTVLTFTPASLAPLMRREALAALPSDQEPLFLNAARVHLLPKLKALGAYPPVSLVLPADVPGKRAWVPVEWQFGAAPGRPSSGGALKGDEPPGTPEAGARE